MANYTDRAIFQAVDKVSADVKRMDRNLDKFFKGAQQEAERTNAKLNKLTGGFGKMKMAVTAVSTVVGGVMTKSIIGANLEMDAMIGAMTQAAGSAEGAQEMMRFVREESERLGLQLRTTGKDFAQLAAAAKGTQLEGQNTKEIFSAVSEASAVLRLSADQTSGALRAIQQIISKGTVQAEELRGQLGERLPGAFQIAARAMGKTTQELGKMLEQGQLTSDVFLPRFAAEIRKTFKDQVGEAAGSARAEINRFYNAIFDLQNTLAESGFMDAFIDSIKTLTSVLKSTGLEKTIAFIRIMAVEAVNAGAVITNYMVTPIKAVDAALDSMAKSIANLLTGKFKKAFTGEDFVTAFTKEIKLGIDTAKNITADTDAQIAEIVASMEKNLKQVGKAAKEITCPELPDIPGPKKKKKKGDHEDAGPLRKYFEDRQRLKFQIEELEIQAQEESLSRDLAAEELRFKQKTQIEFRTNEYIEAATKAHEAEISRIQEEWRKKNAEADEQLLRQRFDDYSSIVRAAGSILSISEKTLPILQKIRALEEAIAAAKQLQAAVSGGLGPLSFLAGGLGLVGAGGKLLFAARGADFETKGPQLMVVGDNPGGRERVRVDPVSGPNAVNNSPIFKTEINFAPQYSGGGNDRFVMEAIERQPAILARVVEDAIRRRYFKKDGFNG
jgi:tape measure domain-containing protein